MTVVDLIDIMDYCRPRHSPGSVETEYYTKWVDRTQSVIDLVKACPESELSEHLWQAFSKSVEMHMQHHCRTEVELYTAQTLCSIFHPHIWEDYWIRFFTAADQLLIEV